MKVARSSLLTILSTMLLMNILIIQAYAEDEMPFTDIDDEAYYYKAVNELYTNGIVRGVEIDKFSPDSNLTYSQALTMLFRVFNKEIVDSNKVWYEQAQDYFSNSYNIKPTNINENISRKDFCNYIVTVFKLYGQYPPIILSESEYNVFQDYNDYNTAILHRLGILTGTVENEQRLFNGDDTLTRAQACTFIYRTMKIGGISKGIDAKDLINEKDIYNVGIEQTNVNNAETDLDNEKTEQSAETEDKKSRTFDYSYYEKLKLNSNPKTVDDIVESLGYIMYNEGDYIFSIPVDEYSHDNFEGIGESVSKAMEIANAKFTEWTPYISNWHIEVSLEKQDKQNYIVYTISQIYDEASISVPKQKEVFKDWSEKTLKNLYDNGTLRDNMSDKEIAKELYVYLDKFLEYDMNYSNATGYKAITEKRAICSAYTGVYNYLCRLCGLSMKSFTGIATSNVATGRHAWSGCESDGKMYYIDVTWGDPIPNRPGYSDLKYFWSETEFSTHSPDPECYEY